MRNIFLAFLIICAVTFQTEAKSYTYYVGFSSLTKTSRGKTVKVDPAEVSIYLMSSSLQIANPNNHEIILSCFKDAESSSPEWNNKNVSHDATFYSLDLGGPEGNVILESTLSYQKALEIVQSNKKGGNPEQYSAKMRILCDNGYYQGVISYVTHGDKVEREVKNPGTPDARRQSAMTWAEFMCSFSDWVKKCKQASIDFKTKWYAQVFKKNPAGKPVDLGLSVKWADRNVGDSETNYRLVKVGWGDPTGLKFSDTNNDYPHSQPLPTSIAGSQYDIARAKWGGNWRLPTKAECEEFLTKCTFEYNKFTHTVKATGPNGNSIILPLLDHKDFGSFWTGDIRESSSCGAYCMYIYKPNSYATSHVTDSNNRFCHEFVRPVLGK